MIEASFNGNIQSKLFADLIAYQTWARKGKVEGVHPDFGRLSYLRSDKLAPHYHLSDDDRVEMLLDLSEKLNNV